MDQMNQEHPPEAMDLSNITNILNRISQALTEQDSRITAITDHIVKQDRTLFDIATQASARNTPVPNPQQIVPQQPPAQLTKEFKPTTVAPPTFTGIKVGKRAHEISSEIETFLFKCESDARIFGYRSDFEAATKIGHQTYVDYASRGLSGIALQKWSELELQRRLTMTWKEFGDWMRQTHGHADAKTQAVDDFGKIHQRTSVAIYTEQFNKLLSACRKFGFYTSSSEEELCIKYRVGLKSELRFSVELKRCRDLYELQALAEEHDDLYWKKTQSQN